MRKLSLAVLSLILASGLLVLANTDHNPGDEIGKGGSWPFFRSAPVQIQCGYENGWYTGYRIECQYKKNNVIICFNIPCARRPNF